MNRQRRKGTIDDFYSGKTILLTGATGYIGRPLTAALIRLGANVHAVSREKRDDSAGPACWWEGNLENLDVSREIIGKAKPELLIHLAAHAWGSQDLSLVPPTFYGCLATTVNVLTAAAETGCKRIVLPGSLEEPMGTDAIPNSPYAAAKWGCQVYGKMFRRLYGLEVIHTRIFMTYGPGQDTRKVIPYIIRFLLSGQSPVLNSHGRLVDWIYIDDVVEGLLAASRWDLPDGQPIDIGSGVGTSVGSVAEKLCRMIDPEIPLRFDVVQKRKDEVVRVADVGTSYRKIGWRPQISLEDGLQKTIAWTKERCRTDPAYRELGKKGAAS